MKIKKLFLVIALLAIFSSYYASAYDFECPENWSPATVEFGPDANGCSWVVSFCYICQIFYGGNITGYIRIMNTAPSELSKSQGCSFPEDPGWLMDELLEFYGNQCTIPACSTVYCQNIIQEFPLCWQWWIMGNYYHGKYVYYKWLEACPGGGYCQIVRKICYDYVTGQYDLDCQDWVTTYQIINLNCQTEEIPKPPDPDPPFIGTRIETECYKRYTCP
ncbi:MAG: hypothetical protein A2X61_01210 [Ignavibacteria bacterium GWB2_35_12]|nr:MAG: hypothetical protein A2X63_13530 [Ignavibacteria bacterium GWA2_35_8]OGU42029.1 MAG: hypothetical protein A2X61_01210 [Ignavibacteria bacterium GWB2_35_12]OGV18730.1 MAG: hypothetical protein A2475_08965 [Ignavibacteria bacterium RIFOXYC2_FULL_35_21]